MYDKGIRNIQWGKRVSSINARKIGWPGKRMKLDPSLTPYTKISSK